MKKLVKNLLFGAGIAAVGLFAYSVWEDTKKPSIVVHRTEENSVPTTTSKEFVERRRQQIREAAQTELAKETSQDSERPEGIGDDPGIQESAPVEPAFAEQTDEQQKGSG